MTRAALNSLPGLDVSEDDGRFSDALARLDKATASKPVSIWDDVDVRRNTKR